MSSKIIWSSYPSVHVQSDPNQSLSFSSQLINIKTRIPTRKPSKARTTARISASYAPARTKETLYELLGIAEDVGSFSDIKKAYKQMARKYHPDVSPPDRVDEYTRRFIMVHEAYETLSNPQTRALYDRDLAFGAGFSNSSRKNQDEKDEWRSSWQSQLDQLQRRDCRERSSWASRMRSY